MMLANRRRVFAIGAWVAFWSVMGGMLGYAIGALFWETAGLWLIHALHVPLEQVEALRLKYSQNAYLIMVQGATPIPYKLVTIASGLAGVSFPLFMIYSAVTRTLRYVVLEGLLVYFFGARAQALLDCNRPAPACLLRDLRRGAVVPPAGWLLLKLAQGFR